MSECPCPTCQGRRLKKEALAVTVGNLNIDEFCHKSVTDALDFVDHLTLTETQAQIAQQILKEIRSRLTFLQSVGLSYLTLSRQAGTLSGGESQRIRLATQIGSSLMGVLYILDEPSIGLHQRDNDMLLDTLKRLRDLGNTLIVVEHDEDTMRAADYIVGYRPCRRGPRRPGHRRRHRRGDHGRAGIHHRPVSLRRQKILVPSRRRTGNGHSLTIRGLRRTIWTTWTSPFPGDVHLRHRCVRFREVLWSMRFSSSGWGPT